jgi:hypothetical protein
VTSPIVWWRAVFPAACSRRALNSATNNIQSLRRRRKRGLADLVAANEALTKIYISIRRRRQTATNA